MDYEKKYKEALELARDYYKANLLIGEKDENLMLEDIFTELKESEDEKMTKRIIEALQRYMPTDELLEEQEMVAWLEKQGEQNPTTLDDADIRKEIVDFICKVTDTSSMSLEEVEKSNKWLEWLNTPQNKQEWSERDAIEALRTEYEKGRHDMREEMIKDAVDAVISQVPGINEIVFYNPASTSRYKYDLPTEMNNLGLNKGDKVKLIIIKTNKL